jgi:hypothetical protein
LVSWGSEGLGEEERTSQDFVYRDMSPIWWVPSISFVILAGFLEVGYEFIRASRNRFCHKVVTLRLLMNNGTLIWGLYPWIQAAAGFNQLLHVKWKIWGELQFHSKYFPSPMTTNQGLVRRATRWFFNFRISRPSRASRGAYSISFKTIIKGKALFSPRPVSIELLFLMLCRERYCLAETKGQR